MNARLPLTKAVVGSSPFDLLLPGAKMALAGSCSSPLANALASPGGDPLVDPTTRPPAAASSDPSADPATKPPASPGIDPPADTAVEPPSATTVPGDDPHASKGSRIPAHHDIDRPEFTPRHPGHDCITGAGCSTK